MVNIYGWHKGESYKKIFFYENDNWCYEPCNNAGFIKISYDLINSEPVCFVSFLACLFGQEIE